MLPLIHFVHGKESGPWGRKISFLSEIARKQGFDVESLDYSDMINPMERAEKLSASCLIRPPDILVGSSMGGWVASAASASIPVRGLFLMAPAFYIFDYPNLATGCEGDRIEIVHGWRDSIIPFQNSIRFGQEYNCTLHLVDDDHRLAHRLDQIGEIFTNFIKRVMTN